MNGESRVTLGTGVVAAAALALLFAGAGATYLVMRPAGVTNPETAVTPIPAAAPSSAPSTGDVVVTLTPEAVERAGLKTATVATGTSGTDVRVPGVVEPNAYRQVAVTPLVSGRVTQVVAQLGARVRKGETMAEI